MIIDRQVLGRLVVRDLVIRTFDHLVLVKLSDALKTERVTARKRDWFLVIVIIGLEAYATFKNLIHF